MDITLKKMSEVNAKEFETPKAFYTIIAASTFHPYSKYDVAITLHDPEDTLATEECVIRVQIEDAKDERWYVNEHKEVVKPNSTKTITLHVDGLSMSRQYKLVVVSEAGLKLKHETELQLQTKQHAILIQCDKAIYKPSDCVKFRVLVLDAKLEPSVLPWNKLNVFVSDSQQNRIKQWSEVETVKGVFENEFQLSDMPNLGDWTLSAQVGDEKKEKKFEVAEYVLPKFEVSIDSPKSFSMKDESLTAIVRAKYTYGKLMKGKASVKLFSMYQSAAHAEKTIQIDGSGVVSFNMASEVGRSNHNGFLQNNYRLEAEVIEELTGLSQYASKEVTIYRIAYLASADALADNFTPGSPFIVKISIRKYDGTPVLVNDNTKHITVKKESCTASKKCGKYLEHVHESLEDFELDSNGELEMTFCLSDVDAWFSLAVIYMGETSSLRRFWKASSSKNESNIVDSALNMEISNNRPKLGEDITVKVISNECLKHYTYHIIAQRKVIHSDSHYLPNNTTKSHEFTFTATRNLVPKAEIIVYMMKAKEIVSAKTSLELANELYSVIDVDLSTETANPGQSVDINVKTSPGSFVGLLGIDQSILLLKSGNDLSAKEALKERVDFYSVVNQDHRGYYDYQNKWNDFQNSNIILFTNILPEAAPQTMFNYPCGLMKSKKMGRQAALNQSSLFMFGGSAMSKECIELKSLQPPVIRKEFPETWLWESNADISSNGLWTIKKQIPDSLTSWMITGFSVDSVNGLGITNMPKKLTVFQPFFVSLNLPYSVKRGEVVTVPCNVFNYLQHDIQAEVIIENEYDEFEFKDDFIGEMKLDLVSKNTRKVTISVPANNATTANFIIRPTKVGTISLKVTAASTIAGDSVIKTLKVESEGVPQFVNKAIFIDLREKSKLDSTSVPIEIPEIALPDSTRVEVNCVGDLLGGTIKNLEKLIRLPYGCGEQNMLNFVPNIVVLNYLKNTHQLTAEIESKAKKFMEIGYQRELTYKHPDGSYSAFGYSGKNGSTWLTAFVAKSFRQATAFIEIQESIIEDALTWISKNQNANGSFKEVGSIFQRDIQGGSSNGVALTAYVLTAFLENNEKFPQFDGVIDKAIKNIVECSKNITDIYAMGIVTYALQFTDHELKNEILRSFINMAKQLNNQMWWEKSIEKKNFGCQKSLTLNTELTAYGLLALLKAKQSEQCLPTLKWLLNQRNNLGGFEGTQDTIIGIEALAKCAEHISCVEHNVNIHIKSGDFEKEVTVDKQNALVLQSELLPASARCVDINATGKGFALLEIAYKFNISEPEPAAAFKLEPTVIVKNSENFVLNILTSFIPRADSIQSNMVVLEVSFPSGFVVDKESLNELKSNVKLIQKVETKSEDTVAIFYFDQLTSAVQNVVIKSFQTHVVDEQRPSSIVIYDYYDNSLRARAFYSLPLVSE